MSAPTPEQYQTSLTAALAIADMCDGGLDQPLTTARLASIATLTTEKQAAQDALAALQTKVDAARAAAQAAKDADAASVDGQPVLDALA